MRELTIDIADENGHQFGFNVITEITDSMELMDVIKQAVSIPVEKRVSPKVATEALNTLIANAKNNLTKAVEREDYAGATKSDSYMSGLIVALGVIEGSR